MSSVDIKFDTGTPGVVIETITEQGPQGPAGPQGPQGPPGPSSTAIIWHQGEKTWSEIMTTASVILDTGGVVTILMDDAGTGNTFVIDEPANLDSVQLASASAQQILADFTSDFQLLGTRLNLVGVSAYTNGTFWLYDGEFPNRYISWSLDNSSIAVNNGSPPMAVIGGASNIVRIYNQTYLQGDIVAGRAAFSIQSGGSLNLFCFNQSNFDGSMVEHVSGAVTFYVSYDDTCSDLTGSYPLKTGVTLTRAAQGAASLLNYTPAASRFANPQPSDVKTAMDRMAALLKTLNSGTLIP